MVLKCIYRSMVTIGKEYETARYTYTMEDNKVLQT